MDWTEPFLAALRHRPVLAHACQAAGVDRVTVWRRRQVDEPFAEAVDAAMEEGIDRAEAEAFRRGVDGWEEPVVYQGVMAPRMQPLLDPDGKPVVDPDTHAVKWVPVLDEHGRPVPLTVNKRSDAMLALVLKGRRKSVYSDRTELTGADGSALIPKGHDRAARVAALVRKALQRADDELLD